MSEQEPALPLFAGLPRGTIPGDEPLILASGSPRRGQLLDAAGYVYQRMTPAEEAECGVCTKETPPETVARLAYRKAADVVLRLRAAGRPGLVVAADTLAACNGALLGKPVDREHAETMLRLLRGRRHHVLTGVCLWSATSGRCLVDVSLTVLQMDAVDDQALNAYLDTRLWEGKAGAFGYQDGIDWLEVLEGSESNVVGLPMERLAELLGRFDRDSERVEPSLSDD